MKKRILSLGIACCLVFNALPGTVRAEGEEPFVQEEAVEETEAEIVEPEVSEEEVSEEEQSEQTEPKEKSDAAETPEEIVDEIPEQNTEENVSEMPEQDTEEIVDETPAESEQDAVTEEPENAEDTSITEEEPEDVQTGEVPEQVTAEENAELSLLTAEPVDGIAVLAADGEMDVTNEKELNAALANDAINTINITKDFTYYDAIEKEKTIVIKSGVTFTWKVFSQYTFKTNLLKIEEDGKFSINKNRFSAQAIVEGKVTNNGIIEVTGTTNGDCLWTASTDGDGTFSAIEGTYISYGTVPPAMLDGQTAGSNYKINVVKDLSELPTVSLPENMIVGDTIKVTVKNLIEGVNLGDVFTFRWTNGSSNERYNGAAEPTLTKAETLNLRLSAKTPYAIRIKGNTQRGTFETSGTVSNREYETLYVDQVNGSAANIGNEEKTPLNSLATAAENIKANGTIILLNDYTGSANFKKSATVKSQDGKTYSLGQTDYSWISSNSTGVTVTLENLTLNGFALNDYSSDGKLVVKNCKGTIQDKSKPIKNIELENSELYDSVNNVENLTLKNTSIKGRVYTKNLTLIGENTITPVKNSPSFVEGTIDGDGALCFSPESPEKGLQLIEVSDGKQDEMISRMKLADTKDGQYKLKGYKEYNGTYIGIAERVTAQGKLGVGNEPALQAAVDKKGYIWVSENGNSYNDESVRWSGYSNTTKNVWSADDMPELIVTLRLLNKNSSFFDDQFDPKHMTVYSVKDVTGWPKLTDENLNTSVQIVVKEGQGASEDGEYFTFTIAYPKVERLDRLLRWIVLTEVRTAMMFWKQDRQRQRPLLHIKAVIRKLHL